MTEDQLSGIRVLTLGEPLVVRTALRPGPLDEVEAFSATLGGDVCNFAIGIARMGLTPVLVAGVGDDDYGRFICATLRSEGVGTDLVSVFKARTGSLKKACTNGQGDPEVRYERDRSAGSQIHAAQLRPRLFAACSHVHLTGIAPALSAEADDAVEHALLCARAANLSISFDFNLRRSLWKSDDAMRTRLNLLALQADWLLPGLEEGRLLTGEKDPGGIARFFLDQAGSQVQAVVVKLGPQGSCVYLRDGSSFESPGYAVQQVDSVGAGDAFASGFVSARLEGLDWQTALRRANWVASRVVQHVGDYEGMPRRAQLPPFALSADG